jgi:hypothetical protein
LSTGWALYALLGCSDGEREVSAPIFISYSSKDQDIAETICQALEVRGLHCWISSRDVDPGENFQEAIVGALRTARVMVLVFTTNANNSDEIKKELVLAGRHEVTVIPVRVEDVAPNDAFAYEFATRQWVDLFKDWEREIESLSSRLNLVLQSAKPGKAGRAEATSAYVRRFKRKPPVKALLWGSALVAFVIIAGGAVFYTPRRAPSVPAPAPQASALTAPAVPTSPTQIAAQSPLPAAPVAQQAAPPPSQPAAQTSSPPPLPAPTPAQTAALAPAAPSAAPQSSPDDLAWQTASSADTTSAFAGYLKEFPGGAHVQDAQLKMADLIMSGSTTTKNFDGAWETTWTCTNVGQFPGYSYRFVGEVKDGSYHGVRGIKGQPGSLDLNGKIEPDGKAAFFGEIIVNSSYVALGAARGTPSDFHAVAQFGKTTATGTRIEGRPCSVSFAKQ